MLVRLALLITGVTFAGLAVVRPAPAAIAPAGPGVAETHAPANSNALIGPSGLQVPRFESLRFDEVNGREGPSKDHPVLWRYVREGLPVEIIAETPTWRKVRDPDGDLIWIHHGQISDQRTALITTDAPAPLRRAPNTSEAIVAEAEPGAIVALGRCREGWCWVEAQRSAGWISADALWGVYPEEAGP